MKAKTLFSKTAAGLGSLAIVFAMSACSHHSSIAEQAGQNTGEIRTEQTAQANPTSGGEVLGTAPAPANAQAPSNPGTPAVISGPAAVDSTGRVYTSSSVGSAGNAAAVGRRLQRQSSSRRRPRRSSSRPRRLCLLLSRHRRPPLLLSRHRPR